MNYEAIGRMILGLGVVLLVIGGAFMLLGKFGWHRLPGDLEWSGRNWRVSFPIATCILLSLLLTLILNLLSRFLK